MTLPLLSQSGELAPALTTTLEIPAGTPVWRIVHKPTEIARVVALQVINYILSPVQLGQVNQFHV